MMDNKSGPIAIGLVVGTLIFLTVLIKTVNVQIGGVRYTPVDHFEAYHQPCSGE